MNLTYSEQTLKKSLLSHNIDINFSDYDGFICALRNDIQANLIGSVLSNNVVEFLDSVFYMDERPSLDVFHNSTLIQNVRDVYIINIINSGEFSIFYSIKEIVYSEDDYKNAYKLLKIKKVEEFILDKINSYLQNKYIYSHFLYFIQSRTIFFKFIEGASRYTTVFRKNSKTFLKISSLPEENILLSIEEKNEIDFEFDEILTNFKFYINSLNNDAIRIGCYDIKDSSILINSENSYILS